MAARNTTITCASGVATALSDGAVANARIVSTEDFYLLATAADTAPTATTGGIPFLPFSVLAADLDLANLFPGVTGPYYLWAFPTSGPADVSISHA